MVSATPPGSPGSTLGSRTASLRSVRLSFKTVESFGSHNKIFKAGKNELSDKLIYLRQKSTSLFQVSSYSRPPSVASSRDSECIVHSRTASFSSERPNMDSVGREGMRSKRCSTISTFSQDSGFTSQDTFSIRSQDPSSPQKGRGAQLYCRGYTTGGSPLHPYSTIKRSQSPFQQTGRAAHYSAPLTGRPPLPRRRPPPPPRCSSLDRHSGQVEGEDGANQCQDNSRPQSQLSQSHKGKQACQSELTSPAHTPRSGGGCHTQRSSTPSSGRTAPGSQIIGLAGAVTSLYLKTP